MSKKTVSVCDKCHRKFANYTVHVREAATNVELKLASPVGKGGKPGPYDLCEDCIKEVFSVVRPEDPTPDLSSENSEPQKSGEPRK